MKIYSVYDPEFKPYGRVLEGYDTTCLMNAVKTVPLPESGAAPGAPFRVAIVLPRGTNFPMPNIAPKNPKALSR